MTDLQIAEKDRDALYIGNIRTVEFDLELPTKGDHGSTITWETGHDRIISVDGKVTRPKYGMGSRTVPMTATIRYGEAEVKRVFEVRVLEEENKIQVEKVYPVRVQAQRGQKIYLPTATAIVTKEGRTIPHLLEWDNGGEAVYETIGTVKEHGVIAGTKFDVDGEIEVVEHLTAAEKDRTPAVHDAAADAYLSGESFFTRAQKWSEDFLLSVNDDQMLYNFRSASGLDTKDAPEMIGWDAPECNLKGHTTGHYLSGLALCYRATGNEKIREKAVYMCESLKKCQDAFAKMDGIHEGFLSGYDEKQFDLLEQYVRYPEIWAPYYTLHKIFAGLLDCYEFANIACGLTIADKLGDWVYNRLSRLPHKTLMKMWSLYIAGEFGGMNEAMSRLYGITGKENHLKAARLFDNDKLFFPLEQKIDALDTMHANQHIPQIIGCMKLFEVTGEKKYYDIAEFFWESVTGHHIYTIGGTGEGEMFHGADEIGRLLSKNTAESCASYNMLKLTKELFSYQPDSRYMDYYERTMFNHIASSCEHAPTGASTYFMPLAPGFRKEFDDENSCCHGTGLENHFKYAESIYFQNDKNVYVNLFVSSVLEEEDLRIVQEEKEDAPGEVTLKVQGSRAFTLKVRVPYWCRGSYQVWVNGSEQSVETGADGYLNLTADWSKETTVEIHFACHYTLERTPDVRDTASLLYGPYVLAALTEEKDYLHLPLKEETLEAQVTKGEGLNFTVEGVHFVPLCSICREGYQVYVKIPGKFEKMTGGINHGNSIS